MQSCNVCLGLAEIDTMVMFIVLFWSFSLQSHKYHKAMEFSSTYCQWAHRQSIDFTFFGLSIFVGNVGLYVLEQFHSMASTLCHVDYTKMFTGC
jgi:hypothetical protein